MLKKASEIFSFFQLINTLLNLKRHNIELFDRRQVNSKKFGADTCYPSPM